MKRTLLTCVTALALAATPALAQDLDIDLEDTQEAIDEMIAEVYVYETVVPKSAADVIAKLEDLGYTEIEDFDVEWDEYEIEATGPDGEEYEIEMDPITGRILEIEEDFL